MKYYNLLFEKNAKNKKINKKLLIINKCLTFQIKHGYLNAITLNRMLLFVNKISKLKQIPVLFDLKNVILTDKLSYILFETICYELIKNGHTVFVNLDCKTDIRTIGIINSPLLLLNDRGNIRYNQNKYCDKFESEIYNNHYCRLITEKRKSNKSYLSVIYTEIFSFLTNFNISKKNRDLFAQVAVELIGNACEHTDSECYVDIDVTNEHYKVGQDLSYDSSDNKYHGINIAILNFSNVLLGEELKNKIKNGSIQSTRYQKLLDAYDFHNKHFNSKYTEEDFFNIAVFQNKISGRMDTEYVGGTGLTYLINYLQQKSDNDNCYVLSGNRIVYFVKEYLQYDDDWIGFNKNNDFFKAIPESEVLTTCNMFFPGTAYNLNFVMQSEDNNE